MVNLLYLTIPVCQFAGALNCPGFGVWQGGEASGWKGADSAAQDRFFETSERKRKTEKPLKYLQKRVDNMRFSPIIRQTE